MRDKANLRLAPSAAITLAAMVVLLVAACAAPRTPIPRYQPPISGATAKLVVRGSVQPGDVYGVYLLSDNDNCRGAQVAGIGQNTRNAPTAILAAGRPTTVDFVLFKKSPSRHCLVRWTFSPSEGKTYLLTGASTAGGCVAHLLDASDPDDMRPEHSALRRNAGTQACVPLAQARASARSASAQDGSNDGDAVLRQGATTDDLQGLMGQ